MKFPGIYRGQVMAHLPNGKCKIFVPGVYPDEFLADNGPPSEEMDIYGQPVKCAQLPDAERALGLETPEILTYPKLKSYVWCMFERGEASRPVFFASVIPSTPDKGEQYQKSFYKDKIGPNSFDNPSTKLPLAIEVGTTSLKFLGDSDRNGSISSIKLEVTSNNPEETIAEGLKNNNPPAAASIELNSTGQVIIKCDSIEFVTQSFKVDSPLGIIDLVGSNVNVTSKNVASVIANKAIVIDTPEKTNCINISHGKSQIRL